MYDMSHITTSELIAELEDRMEEHFVRNQFDFIMLARNINFMEIENGAAAGIKAG